ncbi:hypothetical protein [Lysinibacillus sp. NPDC047702]|uniref:hypothetical protein n=1 Tax=unclassified Lysinibacillus TaxID=2636778 RepID=UPI003D0717ED
MKQEQLNAIKERVAKTSTGEWECRYLGHSRPQYSVMTETEYVAHIYDVNDAEFIAFAREDVPALVAEVERLNNQIHVYKVTDEFVREQSKKVKHFFPLENVAGYGQLCDLVVEQEKKMILLREVVKEFIDYWATTNDARPLLEIVTDARQALGGEADE